MELSPDSILHQRYRIIRLLGHGGMGAVYLAYDMALEHEVAVKINRDPSANAAQQFIAEARLLATLRHPNLPRVMDYFLEGSSQYLVMDYIPGDDLKTLIERHGTLPVDTVLSWAEQLASAVSYLHRQVPPVIHRDIKPANLKLTHEGEVVLVDFGIAKKADPSQATAVGAVGYTPGYAPPEQYGGTHTGPNSDQYSMAATLYHLLSGQKPVDSIQRVLEVDTLQPLGLIQPTIPDYIQAAIHRAMSVRPEDRFGSVEDFIRALKGSSFQATVQNPVTYGGAGRISAQIPIEPAYMPPVPAYSAPRKFNLILAAGILAGVVFIVGLLAVLAMQGVFSPPASAPTLTVEVRPSATFQMLETQIEPSATLPPTATTPATAVPSLTPTIPLTSTASPRPSATATRVAFASGRGIAFSSDRADGKTTQIWLMEVAQDNTGMVTAIEFRQLTFDEGNKSQPAWSPDGNRLLYVAPGGKALNGLDNGLDIFLLDMQNPESKPVNITHRFGDDMDPAWSPDGARIALTNNGRSDKVKMVDIMNPDGSSMQRVSVDLQELNPTWSPGMDLLYVTNALENNILYLRTRATDYKTNTFFDYKAMSERTGQAADPAWSPDGTQIAYTRLVQLLGGAAYGNIQSIVAATRGDQITKLTDKGWDRDPAWSPDSQWIVFTSRRDLNLEIYIIRASGGQVSNLTNRQGIDQQPAWRP